MPAIKLAITGVCGRMGKRLVALATGDKSLQLVAAIDKPDCAELARDAGEIAGIGAIGLPITFDLRPTPDVLIDFTMPESTRRWLKTCRDRKIAMVIGTTGLKEKDHAAIDVAAANIPILQAPNMSVGVNVLLKLAALAAQGLGEDYDVEIVEGHHRFKKDAPSGTGLALADAILKSLGKTRKSLVYGRHGEDAQRQGGQVGMHSLRMGDEVGKHTVYFAALGERVELGHVATNRDTFALGALRAAKWLHQQKPGRYSMGDVLGLK
ncbi:MAG: 4-hydroxy-tetrahydrodipicolinate reductase [Tepidisphaeraceae bacterium]|jgi:4-hydroxy-tetrahydrodipicolinate reductase